MAHTRRHKKTQNRRSARRMSCGSNDTIVRSFIELQNLVKVYHWNTRSYAEHKATDELYERLGKNIDSFVEIMLGKDGSRIDNISRRITMLSLKTKTSLREKMFAYRRFLTGMNKCLDSTNDSDLLSIRDDILADINQFLYLLTLK